MGLKIGDKVKIISKSTGNDLESVKKWSPPSHHWKEEGIIVNLGTIPKEYVIRYDEDFNNKNGDFYLEKDLIKISGLGKELDDLFKI